MFRGQAIVSGLYYVVWRDVYKRQQEAFNDVARIASFHRIQLSPGLNDAARFIHSHLAKEGIQCELSLIHI